MGSAYMPHIGGIGLGDLEFEYVESAASLHFRDYDLNKGVYVVFAVSTYEAPATCLNCGETMHVDSAWDANSIAVFVDGKVVETYGRDSQFIGIEVDHEGRSRFATVYSGYLEALRIKTKWEG